MKKLFLRMKASTAQACALVMSGLTAAVCSTTADAATTGLSTGGTAIAADGFDDFEASMLEWVQGPLGVGLAVTSLLVGGGIGILRSTPLPAVAGLALAAFFAWGPSVIVALVGGGAVVG